MRYDTYTLVALSVEVCLWLFHLSVFVSIATQVSKRVYPFSSAFYKLYVLQSVFDFLTFLNFTLIIRFNFLALLPESYNTSNSRLGMVTMLYSGYTVNFGHFCQVVLALNRYTAIMMPLRHNDLWSRRNVAITFGILMLLPVSMTVVNFFVHIEPVPVDFGHIIVDVNPISSRISAYSQFVVCVATSLASTSLDLRTLYAYRRMSQKLRRQHSEEYRLLVYAILQLFEYLVMLAFCLTFKVIGMMPHNPLVMIFMVLSHVVDLLYLSRPICLLATSLIARRTYLKFYGFLREDSQKSFTRISVVLPRSE